MGQTLQDMVPQLSAGGGSIQSETFPVSGTFVKKPGIDWYWALVIAGGAAGGSAREAAGDSTQGGGGGAGGRKLRLLNITADQAITVGAGGTPAPIPTGAGSHVGGAGSPSSGGSLLSVPGGGGGGGGWGNGSSLLFPGGDGACSGGAGRGISNGNSQSIGGAGGGMGGRAYVPTNGGDQVNPAGNSSDGFGGFLSSSTTTLQQKMMPGAGIDGYCSGGSGGWSGGHTTGSPLPAGANDGPGGNAGDMSSGNGDAAGGDGEANTGSGGGGGSSKGTPTVGALGGKGADGIVIIMWVG